MNVFERHEPVGVRDSGAQNMSRNPRSSCVKSTFNMAG